MHCKEHRVHRNWYRVHLQRVHDAPQRVNCKGHTAPQYSAKGTGYTEYSAKGTGYMAQTSILRKGYRVSISTVKGTMQYNLQHAAMVLPGVPDSALCARL